MLTTTPRRRPRDGCVPSPTMLSSPSGVTSATMATIFDVPMSSPTIRFFASFTIDPPLPCASCRTRPLRRPLAESRHVRGEPVAVPEIHAVDARPRAREHADRPAVDREETREALARPVAAELEIERSPGSDGAQPPAPARRHVDLGEREARRRERGRPLREARRHLGRARVSGLELRQLSVEVGDEDLALRIHEGV